MRHQISLPPAIWVIDNLYTPGLAACQPTSCQTYCQPLWKISLDQYFPRLHHITWGAHTLGTSMLCLWGCGSRGCISLMWASKACRYVCSLTNSLYNPSDLTVAHRFFHFFVSKHSSLPSKLGKPLLLRVCINIHFVSTPQNVDFAHSFPL